MDLRCARPENGHGADGLTRAVYRRGPRRPGRLRPEDRVDQVPALRGPRPRPGALGPVRQQCRTVDAVRLQAVAVIRNRVPRGGSALFTPWGCLPGWETLPFGGCP